MSRKEGPRRGGEDVNGSGQWVFVPLSITSPKLKQILAKIL